MISIHAPQWGATYDSNEVSRKSLFQSTHPSGVRPEVAAVHSRDVLISIHAPQWGATLDGHGPTAGEPISIHAPQWGATSRRGSTGLTSPLISIHAPQWGATSWSRRTAARTRYFNPRTPVGCDSMSVCGCMVICVFQSTHPSGVRQTIFRFRAADVQISIHAPQWGATARMGIAFHNMEAPSVLKTDFIAKIHLHRSLHKFSNQKHQQTIHF